MKLLHKPAQWLYMLLNKRKAVLPLGVRNDLERLHPGENLEEVCRTYGVAKLEKSLTIILIGSVLAIFLALRAAGERSIEDNQILREDVLGAEQTVIVETVLDGRAEQFEVAMMPLQMDDKEANHCYEAFCAKLPELILGANTSLQEVASNLQLLESYEGYPFLVEWKSDLPDVVDSTGGVVPGEADFQVNLRALISYGVLEWEKTLPVIVPAKVLTPEEARRKALEEELIISQEDTVTEEYWTLPGSLQGEPLQWERVVEDNSRLLWVGALLVSVAVYLLGDRDLHQEIEKRKERMKGEYPDIVHKLVLYLGAGMTLQGSFQRIAAEYEERRLTGYESEPAYEEILYTCRELKAGVSESLAYERFGKRTGLQEYIRLSTLMTQNLKKGSSSLLSRLGEEADRALVERIQAGRKLGEEASTKLLLPMVMMLAVVMVMVMLPAFGSMGL